MLAIYSRIQVVRHYKCHLGPPLHRKVSVDTPATFSYGVSQQPVVPACNPNSLNDVSSLEEKYHAIRSHELSDQAGSRRADRYRRFGL